MTVGHRHSHPAFQCAWNWYTSFIDVKDELIANLLDLAVCQFVYMAMTLSRLAAPFCHCPTTRLSVEGNIQRAMIVRVRPSSPRIIGRENASNECDQNNSMFPIITDGVYVPPCIASFRNGSVKPKSEITACAAAFPDKAAIGTPGPGCTLPPAR